MGDIGKYKYGRRRQTFCPKCGKRTRMAGLCAKCQKEKERGSRGVGDDGD